MFLKISKGEFFFQIVARRFFADSLHENRSRLSFPRRCSITLRIFGNRRVSTSPCLFIHLGCTAASSPSCRMKASGKGRTKYKTLNALIGYLCIWSFNLKNHSEINITSSLSFLRNSNSRVRSKLSPSE